MNRIKYAEQLYALISMCLGCAFIVFGLLSFIGILQPTSTSIVQSQRNIGIVFSVLGVAFLIAQAIFTALASAKKKSYYELISNGIKVNGIVEKVYMQKFLQYGKKSPYRVLYSYTYGGKIYHHKSHLLWDKPYMKETDSIAVYINDQANFPVVDSWKSKRNKFIGIQLIVLCYLKVTWYDMFRSASCCYNIVTAMNQTSRAEKRK